MFLLVLDRLPFIHCLKFLMAEFNFLNFPGEPSAKTMRSLPINTTPRSPPLFASPMTVDSILFMY